MTISANADYAILAWKALKMFGPLVGNLIGSGTQKYDSSIVSITNPFVWLVLQLRVVDRPGDAAKPFTEG